VTITGVDEADNLRGDVSWVSPIARALIKAAVGDEVQLMTPGGSRRSRCSTCAIPSRRPGP
jgi:transcription elongation factor GreB